MIGCLYVATSYLPMRSTNPSYVASRVLGDIHHKMARQIATPQYGAGSFQWKPPVNEFIETGETIIAFTAALAGGFVASWFDARAKRCAVPPFSVQLESTACGHSGHLL